MSEQYPQETRRRRSQRHAPQTGQEAQPPLRPNYLPDEAAPMPLGGIDAAKGSPEPREVPQVYDEGNYAPPRKADSYPYYEYDDDHLPPRRWPWVLLSLILVLAMLVAGSHFFIPKEQTGILGQARELSTTIVNGGLGLLGLRKETPPQLLRFESPETEVESGARTVFTFTANVPLEGVRARDEADNELVGVSGAVDPDKKTWTLETTLQVPEVTTFTAGYRYKGTWYQSDKSITLTVREPYEELEWPEETIGTEDQGALENFDQAGLVTEPSADQVLDQQIIQSPELPQDNLNPGQRDEQAEEPSDQTVDLSALLPSFTPAPEGTSTQGTWQVDDASGWQLPDSSQLASGTAQYEEPPFEEPPEGTFDEPWEEPPEGTFDEPWEEPPEGTFDEPWEEPPEGTFDEPWEETPQDPGEEATASTAQSPEAGGVQAAETAPTVAAAPAAPSPSPWPQLSLQPAPGQTADKMNIKENVYQGSRRQSDFSRETPINMQAGELYTYYPGGVFAFRGDGMRQNAAFGQVDLASEQLSLVWQSEIGSLRTKDSGTLYGLGWTGQPAIIKWSVEVREMMNLNEDKKAVKALKEVIFAAQDGKVYFLDLNDGLPTRDVIDIGYPLKSSVAVDPLGQPMMAFGQGISMLPRKTGDIGFYIYNLIDQSKLHFINGRRTKNQVQHSTNGAFDGSALFDRESGSMVVAGENGLLYTLQLNTVFDYRDTKTLTIKPSTHYLRSKGKQDDATVSIEASVAMYGPYAFTADKFGLIRAVDTTTMQTLWAFDAGDNTDATPALDLEGNDTLALYTGTTVHARSRKSGMATLRRLNALTGEEVWKVDIKAKYDVTERSGLKASPVVGQGQAGGLVFFTLNQTEEGGVLLALDKLTGREVWRLALQEGAVSSPVAVYAKDGRVRIIQADLSGKLYLVDALNGQVKSSLDLGGTIEGSPAVYNDMLVIGTSSQNNSYMYGIKIE